MSFLSHAATIVIAVLLSFTVAAVTTFGTIILTRSTISRTGSNAVVVSDGKTMRAEASRVAPPIRLEGEDKDWASEDGDLQPSDDETVKVDDAADVDKRYNEVDEYWSRQSHTWERREKPKEIEADGKCLFVARTRHPSNPTGEPEVVITIMSSVLAGVLRTMLRDTDAVFEEKPEIKANELFLAIDKLLAKQQQLLEQSQTSPPRPSDVEATGETDTSAQTADELGVLMEWLNRAYSGTRQMLERMQPSGQMSYRLLWSLFFPGVKAVARDVASGENTAFLVTSAGYQSHPMGENYFILGDSLQYNGIIWKRVQFSVSIPSFKGTRRISQLPCRPMEPRVEGELKKRGQIARSYAGVHYVAYEGIMWQVFQTSTGTQVVKCRATGRCMVDVLSFRRMNPSQDNIGEAKDEDDHSLSGIDKVPEEELYLLPPTIHGFSLVLKEWGQFLVTSFSDIDFDDDAYEALVLEPSQKSLVKGLVQATRSETQDGLVRDSIKGKGMGTILCLHGGPGAGKTLTAEAISELLHRPLYAVSSGDLGTDAEELEKNLRDTLELSVTWNAVILIDEADVYLEERGLHELHRNALVSVFLRVLDFSSGVLILTTNRVKSFDPAFISRFSVALKYPDLDRASRLAIWTRFLQLAGVHIIGGHKILTNGFVSPISPDSEDEGEPLKHPKALPMTSREVERLAERSLNGRSIRNAVRTAQAMAISSAEPLAFGHLQKVLDVQESFIKDFRDLDTEGVYAAKGESITDRTRLYY